MQFPTRRMFVPFSALLLGTVILVSGCTSGTPTDTTTAAPTATTDQFGATPDAAAASSDTPTVPGTESQAEALEYLQSPERAKRFTDVAPKAGSLIAHALEAGKFGEVEAFQSDKTTPINASYSGEGLIQTPDGDTLAWAHWTHGKIDYGKPITSFGINRTGDDTFVQLSDPDNGESYWTIGFTTADKRLMVTYDINFPIDTTLSSFQDQSDSFYAFPTTIASLRSTDELGFLHLQQNMDYWFGVLWNK